MNWIDKIEKNKKEKRLLVVATDRIFSVRPGGKVSNFCLCYCPSVSCDIDC